MKYLDLLITVIGKSIAGTFKFLMKTPRWLIEWFIIGIFVGFFVFGLYVFIQAILSWLQLVVR